MQTVVEYTCLGMWLSWLARFAHIEEVGGSSPFIPTKHRGTRRVPLCLVKSNGTRSRGKQNGPVERFARPGSESSPGAQHGVQAAVCSSLFNTPYMLYTKTVNEPKTPFLPLSVDQLIRQSPKYAIQITPGI